MTHEVYGHIIEIWEPRYKDKTALIGRHHVTEGTNYITFTKAPHLKDKVYQADSTVIRSCHLQANGRGEVYCVPMSKLKLIGYLTDTRVPDAEITNKTVAGRLRELGFAILECGKEEGPIYVQGKRNNIVATVQPNIIYFEAFVESGRIFDIHKIDYTIWWKKLKDISSDNIPESLPEEVTTSRRCNVRGYQSLREKRGYFMNHDTMIANLQAMQKPCTSSHSLNSRWKKKDKVEEAIRLAEGYRVTEGQCCALFSKVPFEQLHDFSHVILISSHADFVPAITQPYCSSSPNGKLLRGTFDNSITNAAVVNIMQEGSLPDNVVFTLTGDEETGRCYGAKETVEILTRLGVEKQSIYPIALDVTFEGFGRKTERMPVSFSIENITRYDSSAIWAAECLTDAEQAYVCSCAPGKSFPEHTNPKRCGNHYSMYDEGAAYQKLVGRGFSFCIPCIGNMHSDAGVLVETQVYFAYNRNLADFVKEYNKELFKESALTADPVKYSPLTR